MASNYVLVRLTRPQADAILEALCFRTAGDINDDETDHSVEVYERAARAIARALNPIEED